VVRILILCWSTNMPKRAYHVDVRKLPRQSRFGGAMQETAVLMDAAILKFSWGRPGGGEMTGRAAPVGKPDVHPWDQLILLISGRVEATLGENGSEGVYVLEPGHLIYIPANMPHTGRVLGTEEAFGVDVFAPVRKDYLDMAAHQLAHEAAGA
jgi:mannose-6-phosphate isomerase-like protein (cupin superfamily)